ncbi:alkene reductase [Ensifer adhaerens]|uniref:alkene reductase n=1 Tax=Ensifer adhaerens TaxID=106592 RepID=UPI000DC516A2|nr:alkene reductase [Ensifer adhaerens]RAR98757.1 N-ethylmaleimide reductase [Ensifer adhaerens]
MSLSPLFRPLRAGSLELEHRIVMAPLTRMRASQPGNIPTEANAEYYRQRATNGGLIITEATQVIRSGQGYPATPGIHNSEQIDGWRKVTAAVHAEGGKIVLQLWHVGRISHSSFQPGRAPPVGPSAVPAPALAFTANWERVPYETPRALDLQEIAQIVGSYANGARNAIEAGFDGVHGANGYLIEQFLQSRSNRRSDLYGGSIENRTRFLLEVAAAVSDAVGPDRVGVRLSPFGVANGMDENEPQPLYQYAIQELAKLGLAYLHLIEPRASGTGSADVSYGEALSASRLFRPFWSGVLIAAGGYSRTDAESAIATGHADAIAFGRSFISNPDLVERLRKGAALHPWNRETFYGGGSAGYTDYPFLSHIDPQIDHRT